MTTGDHVRIFPHGAPDQVATGVLVLCSGNGHSIAVAFGEQCVPFINATTGMAIHPEHGKMMLLSRSGDAWYDVFTNQQFEVSVE